MGETDCIRAWGTFRGEGNMLYLVVMVVSWLNIFVKSYRTVHLGRGHFTKWNKLDTERQLSHDLSYNGIKKIKLIVTESRMMVTRGQGVKEKGRSWPKDTNFVIRWILVSLVSSSTAWSLFEICYKSRYQVFSLHTHIHKWYLWEVISILVSL